MSLTIGVDETGLISSSTQSPYTDARLRKYNVRAGILHGVQGTLMFIASQAVPNIKAFTKELTTSFLVYDEATSSLVSQTKSVGSIEIGVLAAVFLWLSAVAHAYVVLHFEAYIAGINRETNSARWYEYSLSSSVMICARPPPIVPLLPARWYGTTESAASTESA